MTKPFFDNEKEKKEFKKTLSDFLDDSIEKPNKKYKFLKRIFSKRFSKQFLFGLFVGSTTVIVWLSVHHNLSW